MVWRIRRGRRPDGSFTPLDVSRPGYDVTTATKLQLSFNGDAPTPKLVVKGVVVANPTAGFNGGTAGSTGALVNGAQETVLTINYGRTINPAPDIIAIATAPDWTLPLYTNVPQLGWLANQWHTYLYETVQVGAVDSSYGGSITRNVTDSPSQPNGNVSNSWASAKFIVYGFNNRLEFRTNCRQPVTIKYLVLEGAS